MSANRDFGCEDVSNCHLKSACTRVMITMQRIEHGCGNRDIEKRHDNGVAFCVLKSENGGESMNQVFISGIIADELRLMHSEAGATHLVFALSVQHRTARGVVKRELYTINAWNHTALWGVANLTQGQFIALKGYLTQRIHTSGVLFTEVTAEEFISAPKSPGKSQNHVRPVDATSKASGGGHTVPEYTQQDGAQESCETREAS